MRRRTTDSGAPNKYGVASKATRTYKGDLYATGFFSHAGGHYSHGIARWNGSQWMPVGGGLTPDGFGMILTVHADRLIVAGGFEHAGGIPAANIVAWDGATWHALGSGLPMVTFALTVHDGKLVAGGIHFVRMWNGDEWLPLGADPNFRSMKRGT